MSIRWRVPVPSSILLPLPPTPFCRLKPFHLQQVTSSRRTDLAQSSPKDSLVEHHGCEVPQLPLQLALPEGSAGEDHSDLAILYRSIFPFQMKPQAVRMFPS